MTTDPIIVTETPEEKRKTRRILIGTLVVVVVIAVAAYVASQAGLDKALVRQQLESIATQMRARGKAQGRDITFTYGEIDIQGGFSDRHAVVHDPKLQILSLAQENAPADKPQSLVIHSPVLEILPKGTSLSAMTLSLPQPVYFTTAEEPEKNMLTVVGDTPLQVHYAREKKNNLPFTQWQFIAPAHTKLTYLREKQAQGVEDTTPTVVPVYETLDVAMEKGVGELTLQADHSGLGQGMLEMKSITIAPESAPEEGKVTIAQIISQWSNQRNEKNLNVVSSRFTIDRIEADPKLLPYAPISAAVDVTYEGAMPTTQEELAQIESQESAFKLKAFRISTKDATINATADFTANPEDKLPVGIANVTITNLPFIIGELKKYTLLDEKKEQLVAVLLQQVTGTPYAEMKDVVVDVNRARGGSFKIGKSTFEELFAALLQASMNGNAPTMKPVPVPTIPEEKKAQEPIKLPEETRG